MGKPTIVTAFFNIKRENWKSFGRSEEIYYSYFEKWGLINNDLVAYVESEELKSKIEEFRKSSRGATRVVLINDVKSIDPELHDSIKSVTENPIQRKFRTKPGNPEVWNADYDYIMLMKEWCVKDAVERGYAAGMVAWVDFGYLHGAYSLSEYLNEQFSWDYCFEEKINMFALQKDDMKPIFDIVRSMDTYIMGTILIAPAYLWKHLWELIRENMMCLNKCGLVDDDQTILLMSYRSDPQNFCLLESDWGMPIFIYNDNAVSSPKDKDQRKRPLYKRIGHWGKKIIFNVKYANGVFRDLQKLERK